MATQSLRKPASDLERWLTENLTFEAKKLLRRQATAQTQLQQLKSQVLESAVLTLKRGKSDKYGDVFNEKVSQQLDEFLTTNQPIPQENKLAFAEKVVRQKISDKATLDDITKFLEDKLIEETQKKLRARFDKARRQIADDRRLIKYCSLLYEIDCQKTDDTWGVNKFEQLIISALKGREINLVTVLCTINEFDYSGSYRLVPDPFAYKQNPKLEAVPLIIDELSLIQKFFRYYGVANRLTIYVADTDYTEIGQYGPVTPENLANLEAYLENLRKYTARLENVDIEPISAITNNNPVYLETKQRVLENVTNFKNEKFTNRWYRRFEQAVEKVSESQAKKKLFPENEMRKKSLAITRNIWAANAGQGAVFSQMGDNTLFISTERRERDTNYVTDEDATSNFPPVLYILKSAENWNRKLTTNNEEI